MPTRRSAFFISDRTGITAEMLGHSLLTQFEQVEFSETTLPFIDSPDKAQAAVEEINTAAIRDGVRPLVFSTLVDPDISVVVTKANALVLDCFQIFIAPMEAGARDPLLACGRPLAQRGRQLRLLPADRRGQLCVVL